MPAAVETMSMVDNGAGSKKIVGSQAQAWCSGNYEAARMKRPQYSPIGSLRGLTKDDYSRPLAA
jgi:hypothetical protein